MRNQTNKPMIATLYQRVDSDKLNRAVEMLKVAAHPQRMAILDLLGTKPRHTNSELQEQLGIEQAILSQHLTLMRDKGLVDVERDGRFSYYFLKQPDFMKIISCIESCCNRL